MSILKNAIDSIAIGLEDYQSPDERRIVSSTRNIFAGILLLFKHKLCELSPPDSDEVLIKQRVLPEIDPTDAVRWIGKGNKTVDVQNIKERFESLGITIDWKRLERINKYRNDIEHYFSTLNTQSVQQLISNSFLLIRDFISEHLNEDPKSLLGDKSWAVLIEVNEVYRKEKIECIKAINSLEFFTDVIMYAFESYSCNECGSDLITPSDRNIEAVNAEYICKSCGKTLPYEDIVKLAVSDYFSYEVYLSHTDGGDSPITDCPECDGIYLYDEGICSSCGHVAEHVCKRCGSTIMPEELSSEPFCGFCAHMMAKDD
jgi:transposase-like protein